VDSDALIRSLLVYKSQWLGRCFEAVGWTSGLKNTSATYTMKAFLV